MSFMPELPLGILGPAIGNFYNVAIVSSETIRRQTNSPISRHHQSAEVDLTFVIGFQWLWSRRQLEKTQVSKYAQCCLEISLCVNPRIV